MKYGSYSWQYKHSCFIAKVSQQTNLELQFLLDKKKTDNLVLSEEKPGKDVKSPVLCITTGKYHYTLIAIRQDEMFS